MLQVAAHCALEPCDPDAVDTRERLACTTRRRHVTPPLMARKDPCNPQGVRSAGRAATAEGHRGSLPHNWVPVFGHALREHEAAVCGRGLAEMPQGVHLEPA